MTTGRLLRSVGGIALLVALVAGTFCLGPAMHRSLPDGWARSVAGHAAGTGGSPGARTGPTVVVGTGPITWSDVDPRTTPHLWSLLSDGGSAALVVRSVHATTCPLDGWLGLSAGVRASATGGGAQATPDCARVPRPRPLGAAGPGASTTAAGGPVRVPGWAGWQALARQRLMDARPGLLADTLAAQGSCVQAIGPGAAVAAADGHGQVSRYVPWAASGPLPLDACPVTIVDLGGAGRGTTSLARTDRRIGRVLAQAPDGAAVLVAALSDAGQRARLRLLVVRPPTGGRGAAAPSGLLWSTSTRQLGLVQSADLTATVLARAGASLPDGLAGAPLRIAPAETPSPLATLTTLRGLGQAAARVGPLVAPFFVCVVLLQLLGYGSAWWRWRRAGTVPRGPRAADADVPAAATDPTRGRVAGRVAVAATVAAGIPAATYLAQALPWWRAAHPAAALVGAVAVFAAALAAIGYAGFGWHRSGPVAAVCAGTAVVLGVDAVTGSRLVLSSLLGVQPLVGGRYYGLGNVAFAVLATAVLLAAALLAGPWARRGRRGVAVVVVGVAGLAGVLVDGSPWWGSDLGGVAALLPAVLVLAAGASGARWTWPRALRASAVTVLALVAVLLADWLRPPGTRTHLGRFVEAVVHGGGGDIVLRKLDQNLTVLVSAPLAVLVPAGLAVVVWLLARPRTRSGQPLATVTARVPLLRPALWAVAVCLVLGLLLNDTGVAIPPVSGLVLLPALVALAARTGPPAANVDDVAATSGRNPVRSGRNFPEQAGAERV